MNSAARRGATAALFVAAMVLHSWAAAGAPNTVEGLLLFHGSAAAFDAGVMVLCPRLLKGTLCRDMQNSCFASMTINAIGWAGYILFVPGAIYNWTMWTLSAAQFIRLILPDAFNGNYHFWKPILRRGAPMGKALPFTKTKR